METIFGWIPVGFFIFIITLAIPALVNLIFNRFRNKDEKLLPFSQR